MHKPVSPRGPVSLLAVNGPEKVLEPDLYFSLLSDRIQALAEKVPDNSLWQNLLEADLADDREPREQEVGEDLVLNNPLVRARLQSLGLDLSAPLKASKEAAAVLEEDRQDPANALEKWVADLSRLP